MPEIEKMFTEADIDRKSFNDEERSFIAYASRPVIDRDHEIIDADAWDLKNYRKNPVILFAHDYHSLPVGTSMWIRATSEGLKFKPRFADSDMGNEIYNLYKESVLNAFSVGFIPHKWSDPGEEDEKAKKPKVRRRYTAVELLEISSVPVPSLPTALVEAWEDGKIKTKGLSDYIEAKISETTEDKTLTSEDDFLAAFDQGEEYNPAKPYPNEHACRLNDPGKYDRLRRNNCYRESGGKCVDYIFGIKAGKSELQAMRYKLSDGWTASAARTHCKDAGGMFEAASSETASAPHDLLTISTSTDDTHDFLETSDGQVFGDWEEEQEQEDEADYIELSPEEIEELAREWLNENLAGEFRKESLKVLADKIADMKAQLKVMRGGVG